ncbi:hypothetical protein BU24DRAFT_144630 [Aaosphaeria arxii CBS 175.79]|uniref:Uncharacterized protein n=1 Tax=Aaosphaeria arxii CBS 175.79 TaxID=1450172 RepID=A0A6A5XWY2_9PLEO|nr:uncharacterized protein BU24DRAFT_144630 [Aaosphaeria arxii CBS 175.79]KAF2017150.1 hypothetical protein BU24DRAFT_144630 [Aaosphaeria arxii CBS 175.79]
MPREYSWRPIDGLVLIIVTNQRVWGFGVRLYLGGPVLPVVTVLCTYVTLHTEEHTKDTKDQTRMIRILHPQ